MKGISTVISLLLIAFCSLSGQTSFTAKVDGNKVLEGRTLTITFVAANAKIQNFRTPDFRPFEVISGPATSNSVTINNGRRQSSESRAYTLLADKAGQYTIGSATATINGKTVKTKPIKVTVVKGNPKSGNPDYFVKMEVSDSTAYPGQQIILDYQLYTKVDVNNYNLLNEPEYDGFYTEPVKTARNFEKTIIDGDQYFTKSLKSVILLPQQVGTYVLDPVNMTIGIPTGTRRGFFQDVRTERTTTNGLTIKVQSLPPDAPASFSGAVGDYRMRVSTTRQTLTTDDAITINLEVTGNGDNKYVAAPELQLPDQLELYDPNTIKDEVTTRNGQKVHSKTFEYLIVAEKPGRYTITPEFTYMDTDSNAYVTLRQQSLTYNVLKGSGKSNRPVEIEEEVAIGPISQTTRLRKQGGFFFGTLPYFLLLGLFGGGVLGLYGYRQKLIKSGAFDTLLQRKKKAKLKVIAELDAMLQQVPETQVKERTEIMSNKFNSYITQKFANIDIQFTDQEVLDLLSQQNVSTDLIEQTRSFLANCQMAIYAGVASEAKLYDEVVEIIQKIDSESRGDEGDSV